MPSLSVALAAMAIAAGAVNVLLPAGFVSDTVGATFGGGGGVPPVVVNEYTAPPAACRAVVRLTILQ